MRKRVLAIGMTILGLGAGIFLAEVLLHFFAPPWLKQRMKWTNLGGVMRYGSDAGWPIETLNGKFLRFKPLSQFPVKYYEYNNMVHINSIGTRENGPSDSQKPALGFLGDSFSFGLGVEDHETYVYFLGARLKEFSVLNAGIPGSGLPNQVDLIRLRHKDFGSPNFYVFSVYLGNDFQDILKYYGYGKKNDVRKQRAHHWIDSMSNNRLLGRLYLVQLIQIILSGNQDQENTNLPQWTFHGRQIQPKFLMMNDTVEYKEIVRSYLDRAITQLLDLSRQLGFRSFFIIIPDKHQLDDKYILDRARFFGVGPSEIDPQYPDKFVEQELSKNKIPFVDLFECMKGRQGMYYKMDDHFTVGGHKAAAECIYPQIIQFLRQ